MSFGKLWLSFNYMFTLYALLLCTLRFWILLLARMNDEWVRNIMFRPMLRNYQFNSSSIKCLQSEILCMPQILALFLHFVIINGWFSKYSGINTGISLHISVKYLYCFVITKHPITIKKMYQWAVMCSQAVYII